MSTPARQGPVFGPFEHSNNIGLTFSCGGVVVVIPRWLVPSFRFRSEENAAPAGRPSNTNEKWRNLERCRGRKEPAASGEIAACHDSRCFVFVFRLEVARSDTSSKTGRFEFEPTRRHEPIPSKLDHELRVMRAMLELSLERTEAHESDPEECVPPGTKLTHTD